MALRVVLINIVSIFLCFSIGVAGSCKHREDWVTVIYEDFEAGFPGPTGSETFDSNVGCGYDYWGGTDYRVFQGTQSAWCSSAGINCSTGELNGLIHTYDALQDAWLIFGGATGYNLSDAYQGVFQFAAWYDMDQSSGDCSDYLFYGVSLDGSVFFGEKLCGSSNDSWEEAELDLTNVPLLGNVLGEPNVWFAFHFHSPIDTDGHEGVYLDTVSISIDTDAPTPTVAPTATPSPTPTVTPTPSLLVFIGTNQERFTGGDRFFAYYLIINGALNSYESDLYVILEVPISESESLYFFYPYWTEDITSDLIPVLSGLSWGIIADFQWPYGAGNWGASLWIALTEPNEVLSLWGYGVTSFSWYEQSTPTPTFTPTAPAVTATPTRTPASDTPTPECRSITVPANIRYVDTGITLNNGSRLIIDATGSICYHTSDCEGTRVGPNGLDGYCDQPECTEQPYNPYYQHGALVGMVESSGDAFFVGSHYDGSPGNGKLFLRVNDGYYQDNAGSFEACVLVE